MKYRVNPFDLRMTRGQERLENFLNKLEGDLVVVIPSVAPIPATYVEFALIVERLYEELHVAMRQAVPTAA